MLKAGIDSKNEYVVYTVTKQEPASSLLGLSATSVTPWNFQFQDVNRKKKLNNNFLIILKFFQHLFFFTGNIV
jgi:hypothetical protein